MGEFDQKIALVTGSTSGLGLEIAKKLAEQGAVVILSGRRQELGDQILHSEILPLSPNSSFIKSDIKVASDIQSLFNQIEKKYSRLDLAVNNAGLLGIVSNIEKYPIDLAMDVVDTNLKGTWLCLRDEVRLMKEKGGSIVNLGSATSLVGYRGNAIYSATKHAINGLTKSVALEYASKGIRVNSVCPGVIDTDMNEIIVNSFGKPEETKKSIAAMHPLGRIATVAEIAEACIWLLSNKSSFVTGTSLSVDGGWTAQ